MELQEGAMSLMMIMLVYMIFVAREGLGGDVL